MLRCIQHSKGVGFPTTNFPLPSPKGEGQGWGFPQPIFPTFVTLKGGKGLPHPISPPLSQRGGVGVGFAATNFPHICDTQRGRGGACHKPFCPEWTKWMLAVHEKCTIFAPSIIKNRSQPCVCQEVLLNLHRCSHCAAARHRRRKRSSSSVISESRQLTGMTGQAKDALPLEAYIPI